MNTLGQTIYEKQKESLTCFMLAFQKHYIKITDTQESANFIYNTSLGDTSLYELLLSNWKKDFSLQYTSVGIQKNDLNLLTQGRPVKRFKSQWQQKFFLIAVMLSQFDLIKKRSRFCPILLLDDIFDKLDEQYVERLIQLVNETYFDQIFISNTQSERMEMIIGHIKLNIKYFI